MTKNEFIQRAVLSFLGKTNFRWVDGVTQPKLFFEEISAGLEAIKHTTDFLEKEGVPFDGEGKDYDDIGDTKVMLAEFGEPIPGKNVRFTEPDHLRSFEVGDRVQILRLGLFLNATGKIEDTAMDSAGSQWFRVVFEDGNKGAFKARDLKFIR